MSTRVTWTKSYFSRATQWYRVLLLTPLLLLITTIFADRRKRMFLSVVTIYAVTSLLTATGLAVDNSIRYLHPLSWAFFVFMTYWITFFLDRRLTRTARSFRSVAPLLVGCCFLGAVCSYPGIN
jgi:hypothetical protein